MEENVHFVDLTNKITMMNFYEFNLKKLPQEKKEQNRKDQLWTFILACFFWLKSYGHRQHKRYAKSLSGPSFPRSHGPTFVFSVILLSVRYYFIPVHYHFVLYLSILPIVSPWMMVRLPRNGFTLTIMDFFFSILFKKMCAKIDISIDMFKS